MKTKNQLTVLMITVLGCFTLSSFADRGESGQLGLFDQPAKKVTPKKKIQKRNPFQKKASYRKKPYLTKSVAPRFLPQPIVTHFQRPLNINCNVLLSHIQEENFDHPSSVANTFLNGLAFARLSPPRRLPKTDTDADLSVSEALADAFQLAERFGLKTPVSHEEVKFISNRIRNHVESLLLTDLIRDMKKMPFNEGGDFEQIFALNTELTAARRKKLIIQYYQGAIYGDGVMPSTLVLGPAGSFLNFEGGWYKAADALRQITLGRWRSYVSPSNDYPFFLLPLLKPGVLRLRWCSKKPLPRENAKWLLIPYLSDEILNKVNVKIVKERVFHPDPPETKVQYFYELRIEQIFSRL